MRYTRHWPLASASASAFALALVLTPSALGGQSSPRAYSAMEWTAPGGDLASTRYSSLDELNTSNVAYLFNIRTADRRERWSDPYAASPSRASVTAGSTVWNLIVW